MIKLKPRPPEPGYLHSNTVTNKKTEIRDRISAGESLQSTVFFSYWLNEEVRKPLFELHQGKCCYCERKREMKRESDVEHYRPKSAVTEDPNHPGYWWLAYKWTNYLFSCKPCNQSHKKNHFPLLPGSTRATSPQNDLSLEHPVIINPIDDDAESFISYDWRNGGGVYVKICGTDQEQRGVDTIEILGLNENHLMEERAEILPLLELLADRMIETQDIGNASRINHYAQLIHAQTSAKRIFAGFRRAFFRERHLKEYVATD